jgi:hypothetical protein
MSPSVNDTVVMVMKAFFSGLESAAFVSWSCGPAGDVIKAVRKCLKACITVICVFTAMQSR